VKIYFRKSMNFSRPVAESSNQSSRWKIRFLLTLIEPRHFPAVLFKMRAPTIFLEKFLAIVDELTNCAASCPTFNPRAGKLPLYY
jgi:hypothetical protein